MIDDDLSSALSLKL